MRAAVLGYGTVGSGVVELLKNDELIWVFNRYNPIKKAILKELYTDDIEMVLNDDSVEVVIETMGGIKAYAIIKKALMKRKHVITANKEVVALYLDELIRIAKANNVLFLFEASVGGGMPVVRNIADLVKSDYITYLCGILNGTTNYILTRLTQGKNFADALKEAQDYGYAELDPTSDLEGLDMLRKINILAMLSTNAKIVTKDIYHYGITKINQSFVEYLKAKGYVVKFISEAVIVDNNVQMVVEPVAVKPHHWFANINEANNGLLIKTVNRGNLFISGLGAGKLATAAAIIDDLTKIKNNENYLNYQGDKVVNLSLFDDINNYFVYTGKEVLLKENISRNEAKKYEFYARII